MRLEAQRDDHDLPLDALRVNFGEHLRGQELVPAVVLQLDGQLDPSVRAVEKLVEASKAPFLGRRLVVDSEPHVRKRRQVGGRDLPRIARQPHQIFVMHHDDRAIPGALDVDLGDVGVRLDRPLEREQRILGRVVRAGPMGDDEELGGIGHAFECRQRRGAVDQQGADDEHDAAAARSATRSPASGSPRRSRGWFRRPSPYRTAPAALRARQSPGT